jgi:type IX secretion system PorP/SprF family membrane protein
MFLNYFYKYYYLLISGCFTTIIGISQGLHYSNNHENLFNLNPAVITQNKGAAFYLNYRNQWPGSSDFVNYSGAFINTFKNLKSTVGLQIIRDNQGKGIICNTGFALNYGYRTKLSDKILFSSGLSGSYNIYSVNTDKLSFENNQIPATLENSKKKYFDFAAGVEFGLFDKNHIGVAVSHITSPQVNTENSISKKLTLSYNGHYNLINHYSFRKIFFEPLILTSVQSNLSEIIYGGRIEIEGIQGGLYLRNNYNLDFDSFIILLGINFGKITVNYSYDINLSGAQSRFNKLASHEVTFFYNLEYNIRRNKKGAIKCPKI